MWLASVLQWSQWGAASQQPVFRAGAVTRPLMDICNLAIIAIVELSGRNLLSQPENSPYIIIFRPTPPSSRCNEDASLRLKC